jgi:hypothetical protein
MENLLNNYTLLFLALVIVGGIVFYVINLNKNTKEGFSDSADFAKTLKNKIDNLKDELLVSKYRTEYENILLDMDEFVNLVTLKELVTGMGLKDKNDITMNDIETIQNYKHLRENIEYSLKFMDSMK